MKNCKAGGSSSRKRPRACFRYLVWQFLVRPYFSPALRRTVAAITAILLVKGRVRLHAPHRVPTSAIPAARHVQGSVQAVARQAVRADAKQAAHPALAVAPRVAIGVVLPAQAVVMGVAIRPAPRVRAVAKRDVTPDAVRVAMTVAV